MPFVLAQALYFLELFLAVMLKSNPNSNPATYICFNFISKAKKLTRNLAALFESPTIRKLAERGKFIEAVRQSLCILFAS